MILPAGSVKISRLESNTSRAGNLPGGVYVFQHYVAGCSGTAAFHSIGVALLRMKAGLRSL